MNKDITLEDLGYNELIKHKTYMFYIKSLKENIEYENDEIHLEFNFENKTICKTYGDDNTVCEITVEELQAIYNKCKELGWVDE